MGHLLRIAVLAAALTLAAAPALALAGASQGGQENGKGNSKTKTPGPKASLPEKAKAYGRYCKGQSKKHEKGTKGTDFSRCVTAMAKAANNKRLTARQACRAMSKKHVKGEKRTPFARCVTAAAKLRKAESS